MKFSFMTSSRSFFGLFWLGNFWHRFWYRYYFQKSFIEYSRATNFQPTRNSPYTLQDVKNNRHSSIHLPRPDLFYIKVHSSSKVRCGGAFYLWPRRIVRWKWGWPWERTLLRWWGLLRGWFKYSGAPTSQITFLSLLNYNVSDSFTTVITS